MLVIAIMDLLFKDAQGAAHVPRARHLSKSWGVVPKSHHQRHRSGASLSKSSTNRGCLWVVCWGCGVLVVLSHSAIFFGSPVCGRLAVANAFA